MSTGDPNYDVPCDMACDAYKDAIAVGPYRFPATKWAASGNAGAQYLSIRRELREATDEFVKGDDSAEAIELFDVIQAVETRLRQIGITDVEAARVVEFVRAKNELRGYYGGDVA